MALRDVLALASLALLIALPPSTSATAPAEVAPDADLVRLVEALARQDALPADVAGPALAALRGGDPTAGAVVLDAVTAVLADRAESLGLEAEDILASPTAPDWLAPALGFEVGPSAGTDCEDQCDKVFRACVKACHSSLLACVAALAAEDVDLCTAMEPCVDVCEEAHRKCIAACEAISVGHAALSSSWDTEFRLEAGCVQAVMDELALLAGDAAPSGVALPV